MFAVGWLRVHPWMGRPRPAFGWCMMDRGRMDVVKLEFLVVADRGIAARIERETGDDGVAS